ncbi:endospore germination permease [Metabacillus fastidiosus]|uniref:GerAB/ArcD/ProY family transporter n=1 Tax=Metabacillus fastidiosus TaxID=1458 RepID=UPI002DBCF6A9|nr:endospore germination permease [Metabacillus fastidiosus]MEC2078543.1 endospore germination permease [Metabacillus fastidiosus]
MDNIKISSRQFLILIILYTIGTAILIIPSSIAHEARQDAWIAAIIGVGLGLPFVMLYITLGNMFPNMTLIEMTEHILGKWLGKIVSLSLVFFGLTTSGELLYFIGDFITIQMMPETPIEAIHILFACIIVLGVRYGLETIIRSAELLFPWFIFLFIILIVLIAPQVEFENIQPVFDIQLKPMIRAILLFTGVVFLPLFVFLMIFPVSVNKTKQAKKAFFLGMLIGGIFLVIVIILSLLILGVDTTIRQVYPSYALAKMANIGNFMQRIEAIVAFIWIITIYFRVIVYFYLAVIGLAQTLNLKSYRPLTLPLGIILVVISLIVHSNTAHFIEYNSKIWVPYISIYGLFLPLLLLIIAKIRKKKAKEQNS